MAQRGRKKKPGKMKKGEVLPEGVPTVINLTSRNLGKRAYTEEKEQWSESRGERCATRIRR